MIDTDDISFLQLFIDKFKDRELQFQAITLSQELGSYPRMNFLLCATKWLNGRILMQSINFKDLRTHSTNPIEAIRKYLKTLGYNITKDYHIVIDGFEEDTRPYRELIESYEYKLALNLI